MSRDKKDPSPEFLSFVYTQLEILPSPARGEGNTTPNVETISPTRLTSVWKKVGWVKSNINHNYCFCAFFQIEDLIILLP